MTAGRVVNKVRLVVLKGHKGLALGSGVNSAREIKIFGDGLSFLLNGICHTWAAFLVSLSDILLQWVIVCRCFHFVEVCSLVGWDKETVVRNYILVIKCLLKSSVDKTLYFW